MKSRKEEKIASLKVGGDRVTLESKDEEVVLQPLTHTLLDLRGSVPVSEPQDLDAIRRRVTEEHARKGIVIRD
jgi:hypothetical protein